MDSKQLINLILTYASQNNLSDVHIVTDSYPRIRSKNWEIQELSVIWANKLPKLDFAMVNDTIKVVAKDEWYMIFLDNKEYDTSYTIENWDRYRVNCYMDSSWYSVAFRLIPKKIPTLEELGLWDVIKELCRKSKWLILVTWPTGSWKSTNLAAMIDYINSNFKKHIITIEDPIEFSFNSKESLVNQREVWTHTEWFDRAIRASLREDPDVIMVWEMRDPETIKAAITLAETGHLVFSTLHTNDSVQTIDRIVDVFPWTQQAQIRMQLSQSLLAVLSQRLVPKSDGIWRIASRELLVTTDAVKNLIITWKTNQLYSVLEVWGNNWMILMDKYLLALYNNKKINKETLLSYVRDKDNISLIIE